jgi:hypothetical protein
VQGDEEPAESIAGTTPTFSVFFSAWPKFVGSVVTAEVPSPVDAEEVAEQPAASPATAVSATAHAVVRPNLPIPTP